MGAYHLYQLCTGPAAVLTETPHRARVKLKYSEVGAATCRSVLVYVAD
jgi:hypothetical protein